MYGNNFPRDDFPYHLHPPPSHLLIPNAELQSQSYSNSINESSASCYNSPTSLGGQSSHSFDSIAFPCNFDLLEAESNLVRRALSSSDFEYQHGGGRRSESPFASESNAIIESMSKAYPYGPEEKKEKIEKYRSKRNQRNFTKKIKYECRKTLADSRPRIRGRFAKNEETKENPQWITHHSIGEEEDEQGYNYDNWVELIDSFAPNSIPYNHI